jgi:fatty acid elongase 3
MSLADFIEKNVPFTLPHYLTHYVAGQTPISTNKAVATALVSYLAIIFGLQELMKTRQPLKLNVLFQLHNAILTIGSGLLLACMAEEVIPILWRTGLFNAICSEKSWTPVRIARSRPILFRFSWRSVDVSCVEMNFAHSRHALLCASWLVQRLEFYYIINYSFKYLELLDTVFLVLKKKPLGS